MLKASQEHILKILKPEDIVLDIGGWAKPFTRVNYVVDIMPYESRGILGIDGPGPENFSKENWFVQDICGTKLPFGDKKIDFVVCSHVLEDIRDPIFLCSEIIRVGKRGYLEVPSRTMESIWGLQGNYAGEYHHRWLVEINDSKITFRFKNSIINDSWKFHLPKSYSKKIPVIDTVQFLFWENSFDYQEVIQLSAIKTAEEMANFIKNKNVYPKTFYFLDESWEKLKISWRNLLFVPPPNIKLKPSFIRSLLDKLPFLRILLTKLFNLLPGKKSFLVSSQDPITAAFWKKTPEVSSSKFISK